MMSLKQVLSCNRYLYYINDPSGYNKSVNYILLCGTTSTRAIPLKHFEFIVEPYNHNVISSVIIQSNKARVFYKKMVYKK